jgi:hypothetical protein
MKAKKQTVSQFANSFARKNGWARATKITLIPEGEKIRVTDSKQFGHRKNTTGQYVPNAYLANFGWKNTFYQHAVYELEIPVSLVEHCTDFAEYPQ